MIWNDKVKTHKVQGWIEQYAPDFAWCSRFDLFTMMECDDGNEDLSYNSFQVCMTRLFKKGD